MNCLIKPNSSSNLLSWILFFNICSQVTIFFSVKILFTSANYLNITPWNCELKENSHLRFGTYKNLITNQTTWFREAFIFISTKSQIWDTFFSFCLLLLIRLSSNYLFFFKIWGLSLVANQFPFLFRHKALSTMLSQIQSSISSSQGNGIL